MTLDEMEVQAQRLLDGMRANPQVTAKNVLTLVAVVRQARERAAKAPPVAGSLTEAFDEIWKGVFK